MTNSCFNKVKIGDVFFWFNMYGTFRYKVISIPNNHIFKVRPLDEDGGNCFIHGPHDYTKIIKILKVKNE